MTTQEGNLTLITFPGLTIQLGTKSKWYKNPYMVDRAVKALKKSGREKTEAICENTVFVWLVFQEKGQPGQKPTEAKTSHI